MTRDDFIKSILEEVHMPAPVDPYALCWCLGLVRVHMRGADGLLDGNAVLHDTQAPEEQQGACVLRACAQRVLELGGYPVTGDDVESAVRYLGSAASSAA